jgi:hypothetical protein
MDLLRPFNLGGVSILKRSAFYTLAVKADIVFDIRLQNDDSSER